MIKQYLFIIGLTFKFLLINAQENNLPGPAYLNRKIKSIEVDSNYNNGDWKAVLKQVKNKRIILLGELNHGSKEIFLSRSN